MPEQPLRLRSVIEADLPDYVKWLNDPEVTEFTAGESGEVTLAGERDWFAHISDPESGVNVWAVEADGRHIGNCALRLGAGRQTAGFGIVIGDKTAWNKGYGTAACREVLRIGFQEMGLHRIHLEAFADNGRAIRCYEKCGFRREGLHRQARWKRGEWRDAVSMAIVREEWEAWAASVAPSPGEVRVRIYRPSDWDQVSALWQAVGFDLHDIDSPEAFEYKLRHDRGPFLVAEREGRIVGTAVASWDGRWAWINRVAVDPTERRRGIGRRLMAEVESRLKRLGAKRVSLLVMRDNKQGLSFYQTLGYEFRERVAFVRKIFTPREEDCSGSQQAAHSD